MSEGPFTTFERLETCHRVEVTEDNIHILAKHFGWVVDYGRDMPRLQRPADTPGSTIEVGAWVDIRGNRWNPAPLTQGWRPEGTYVDMTGASDE